MATPL